MFKNKIFLLKAFLLLASFENAAALYALMSIPSDTKNALLLGFSASRIALIGGVLFILLLTLGMLAWIFTSRPGMERAADLTNDVLFAPSKKRALVFTCGVIGAAGAVFLLLPAEWIGEALHQRVMPVAMLAAVLALQTLAFQFIWRGEKINWDQINGSKQILTAGGIALAGFIGAWIYIAWSGLGIKPEASGWLTPGTPLLAQQVLLAWLIGIAFIAFRKQLDQYKRSDLIIALVLWGIAGLVWWLEPMRRWGYFTPAPTPPNFEYYPYSDAVLHDSFAQNILIGTSRQINFTVRPLYTIFIALLHVLFGQKFETVIAAQVFILAIAPAFIYLLAMKLGGRAAGILAATLVILREKNSIAATNIIEVSHSKLLMSDLPTMTVLVIFMFFLVHWLQDQKNRMYLGALAGAFLGTAILIRSQSEVIIPVALLGILAAKKDGWKSVVQKSLVFLLGVLVIVAPWVWRNYQVSGRAVIEYQEAYTRFFASSYVSSQDELKMLPNETVDAYDARVMSLIVRAVLDNPQKIIREYFSYFVHNEILSVTYLPMTPQFKGFNAYVEEMRLWSFPKEKLPARILPIFFLTLCVIAVGIGTAFQRAGWLGAVIPLLFHFAYSFSVTFIHASGWRFILPVDWVSLLYFSIGLIQISMMLFSLFTKKQDEPLPFNAEHTPLIWKSTITVLTIFAVIGISFPLFEWSFPERYPAMGSGQLIQKFIPNGFSPAGSATISPTDVDSFLKADSNAVVVYGRALYPAYYELGKYWGDSAYLTEARKYARLEFTLIGPRRSMVYIPTDIVPKYFPHAADVFIIGCNTPNAIRALAIRVNDTFVTTSPWHGLTCNTQ